MLQARREGKTLGRDMHVFGCAHTPRLSGCLGTAKEGLLLWFIWKTCAEGGRGLSERNRLIFGVFLMKASIIIKLHRNISNCYNDQSGKQPRRRRNPQKLQELLRGQIHGYGEKRAAKADRDIEF